MKTLFIAALCLLIICHGEAEANTGYIVAGAASYTVAAGSSSVVAITGIYCMGLNLIYAGQSVITMANVIYGGKALAFLLVTAGNLALAVPYVVAAVVVTVIIVAIVAAVVIGVLVGAKFAIEYLMKKYAPIKARKRMVHSKSMLSVDPDMEFDLSSMPADPKVVREIKRRYNVATQRTSGGLRGRSYGLTKRQSRNVVPDAMGRFTEPTRTEYRGVMKGMKPKTESRKVDLGIGQSNKFPKGI